MPGLGLCHPTLPAESWTAPRAHLATYSSFHSINIFAHLLAGTRLCTKASKCKGSECLFSKADSALTWELISLPQFFFVIPSTLQGCHAVKWEYGESVQNSSEHVPPRMHTVQQREGTEGWTAHSRHSGDFIWIEQSTGTHMHTCTPWYTGTHTHVHTHTRHRELPQRSISLVGRWSFPDLFVEKWLFLDPGIKQVSWFQGFLISGTWSSPFFRAWLCITIKKKIVRCPACLCAWSASQVWVGLVHWWWN